MTNVVVVEVFNGRNDLSEYMARVQLLNTTSLRHKVWQEDEMIAMNKESHSDYQKSSILTCWPTTLKGIN